MVNVNPDTSPPNGFRQKMISTTITVMMMMVWSRCGGCCGSDDDNADNGEVYGSPQQRFIGIKVYYIWQSFKYLA